MKLIHKRNDPVRCHFLNIVGDNNRYTRHVVLVYFYHTIKEQKHFQLPSPYRNNSEQTLLAGKYFSAPFTSQGEATLWHSLIKTSCLPLTVLI